jgi:hypothetical protein
MEAANCGRRWSQIGSFDGIDVAARQSWWLEIMLFSDAQLITLIGVGNPNINSWY